MPGNTAKPTRFQFLRCGADDIGDQVGGYVEEYAAGAALNVGDLVYLSAAQTANKSAVAATVLGKLLGIVCGGTKTAMLAVDRKLDVGVQAAATGERVLVLSVGKYWAVSDAAITAGDLLTAGTGTAGRVKLGTVTTDVAAGDTGRLVGNALEAAGGAAVTIMVHLRLS
jgi:hypothetical protein